MPILLNTVFGAPAFVIGLVESLAEGTAAGVKLLSSRLNRWASRKSMVVAGYSLAAVGKFIIALALVWPLVLLGRVVDRIGKGLRSAPRDAVMLDGTNPADRGKIVGFHRAADTFGAVLGPALALLLLSLFAGDIRSVLWIALIPAVLSALVTLMVRDSGHMKVSVAQVGGDVPTGVNRLIWVIGLFSLLNFPDALILLHLSQSGWSVTSVVGAYLLFNVSAALLSFPFGALSDRFKPSAIYAFGLLCFSVCYLGLAYSSNFALDAIFVVVYGGFAAANETVGKSWVSKLAPASGQLKAQSRLQGFTGFSVLAAGLWAGACWGATGVLPLLISGGLGLLVALFIWRRGDLS